MQKSHPSRWLLSAVCLLMLLASCAPGGRQVPPAAAPTIAAGAPTAAAAPVSATEVVESAAPENPTWPAGEATTLTPSAQEPATAVATPASQPAEPVEGTAASPIDIGGVGVLGDSSSDEYRGDEPRGGEYGETTLNWVEQLVKSRGINFGKWGTWDEPRRTGFEYNWARSGAKARNMRKAQVPGLAKQVAEGKVSFVVIYIGGNDFHLKNGPYEEIYNGALSGAALQQKLDDFANDITYAMDTVIAAGKVKMAVVTVIDQGAAPQAPSLYPDARKRKRVTDAINAVNAKIEAAAQARGVIVVDANKIGNEIITRYDPQGFLHVGGEKIDPATKGNEPHHLQLDDNIGHSGTVLSGITANAIFIEPFNKAFGLGIPPLTDEEILRNAGIIR